MILSGSKHTEIFENVVKFLVIFNNYSGLKTDMLKSVILGLNTEVTKGWLQEREFDNQ